MSGGSTSSSRHVASQLRRLLSHSHSPATTPIPKPKPKPKPPLPLSPLHLSSSLFKPPSSRSTTTRFSFSFFAPPPFSFRTTNALPVPPLFSFQTTTALPLRPFFSFQTTTALPVRPFFSSARRFWTYEIMTPHGLVLLLIAANVAVFLLWGIADPSFMRNHFMLSLDNFKSARFHTLITSAFSHSSLDHLLTNMIGLYFFGQSIAELFGPKFLLKLYLGGALAGSIFFLVNRAFLVPSNQNYRGWDSSHVPALGASAAVNAIILLEVFLFPKRLVYLYLLVPVPAAILGATLIATDLWRIHKGQDHVSGAAHLGGALVAALVWARFRKRI